MRRAYIHVDRVHILDLRLRGAPAQAVEAVLDSRAVARPDGADRRHYAVILGVIHPCAARGRRTCQVLVFRLSYHCDFEAARRI